jgi:hypothetical protein
LAQLKRAFRPRERCGQGQIGRDGSRRLAGATNCGVNLARYRYVVVLNPAIEFESSISILSAATSPSRVHLADACATSSDLALYEGRRAHVAQLHVIAGNAEETEHQPGATKVRFVLAFIFRTADF